MCDGFNRSIEIRLQTPITLENMQAVEDMLPTSLSNRLSYSFCRNAITIDLRRLF